MACSEQAKGTHIQYTQRCLAVEQSRTDSAQKPEIRIHSSFSPLSLSPCRPFLFSLSLCDESSFVVNSESVLYPTWTGIASLPESATELNPRLFLLAWFRPSVSARSRRNGPLCWCCCCLIHQTIDNKRTAHTETDRHCMCLCFCFNGRRCALCVCVCVCSKRKILAHCSTKRQVHFAAVAKFASCVRRRHRLSK